MRFPPQTGTRDDDTLTILCARNDTSQARTHAAPVHLRRIAMFSLAAALLVAMPARAQDKDKDKEAAPQTTAVAALPFHVEPRGYGLVKESQPPRYVRRADRTGIDAFEKVDWLDVGFELRLRYEHRDNDYRRSRLTSDDVLLGRTRLYLGIRQRFDPFRFVVELVDSRRGGGEFPRDDRDVNLTEPLQMFGEVYLANGAGKGRPVGVRVGRHAFEFLDRRLLARNEWRNTANSFDGLRATIGRPEGPWQVDVLALKPVRRLLSGLDRPDDAQRLVGTIGDWRRWSRVATVQPYYLRLTREAQSATLVARDIHTLGVRSYGLVGRSGWDWDLDAARQFGKDGTRAHRGSALVVESGFTARHAWKPRLSTSVSYASGDQDPNDGRMQRFERLFGFARPFSASDYVQWENLRASKLRLELSPTSRLRIDAGVSGYWLDSATDRWSATGLRDPLGRSGTALGVELDARARMPIGPRLGLTLGYARFAPGAFARTVSGHDAVSHFPYVELAINAFR